jgi:hypothetical protein
MTQKYTALIVSFVVVDGQMGHGGVWHLIEGEVIQLTQLTT